MGFRTNYSELDKRAYCCNDWFEAFTHECHAVINGTHIRAFCVDEFRGVSARKAIHRFVGRCATAAGLRWRYLAGSAVNGVEYYVGDGETPKFQRFLETVEEGIYNVIDASGAGHGNYHGGCDNQILVARTPEELMVFEGHPLYPAIAADFAAGKRGGQYD